MADETEGGINKKLTNAVNMLLDEVGLGGDQKKKGRPKTSVPGEEKPGEYSLEQKLKVLDRALKLEQLRLKVVEEGEGSGFDD